jgi:MSHA pilin protein MshA
MKMKKQQSGFTLIELVMVIVILGILAAFALPKFADLSGDARASVAKGGLGAVKSAAGIAHAAYLAGGSVDPTIEGTTYVMVNGYPDASDISALANLDDGFTSTPGGTTAVTVNVTGTAACAFTYTEAASAGVAPSYVEVVVANC